MKKSHAMKKSCKPKVRKVALPVAAVLEVAAPKGHVPVVVAAAPGIVKIIPVPAAKVKETTWLEWLFGTSHG